MEMADSKKADTMTPASTSVRIEVRPLTLARNLTMSDAGDARGEGGAEHE